MLVALTAVGNAVGQIVTGSILAMTGLAGMLALVISYFGGGDVDLGLYGVLAALAYIAGFVLVLVGVTGLRRSLRDAA